jgi:uncharacterized lipoprotein YddW (UPF0748 family)
MNWKKLICIALLVSAARLPAAEATNSAAKVFPPPPPREFRGAWIATVANIVWPSKPGLTVAQQKAELVSLIDRAAQLHFNAVLFQVRPVADAFYASPLEPWSEYLTGTQGRAPSPAYDPLALAVAEAHKRGLELHAWFNPFRAGHPEAKSPTAQNHAIRTRPDLIRRYGKQTWFDPGEPDSQVRALNAVLDVVKRYDVDGVVFDDYFYPYPEKNADGRVREFPDDASWKKYGAASGLSRDDWRRDNVNRFVQKVSQSVHAAKPWVEFGVSPFGIWRPGVPTGINPKALDAYDQLYADARLWLASGWVDYLAPQLYWPMAQREHSFSTLFQWWRQQNPKGRHVYAALYDAAVGTKFSTDEIPRQIKHVRAEAGNSGVIHYHLRNVLENTALTAAVKTIYAQPALPPATTWLDATPPAKPKLSVSAGKKNARVHWEDGGTEPARWWVLQVLADGEWLTEILPAGQGSRSFDFFLPDAVVIRAVDRLGNLSAPSVWAK